MHIWSNFVCFQVISFRWSLQITMFSLRIIKETITLCNDKKLCKSWIKIMKKRQKFDQICTGRIYFEEKMRNFLKLLITLLCNFMFWFEILLKHNNISNLQHFQLVSQPKSFGISGIFSFALQIVTRYLISLSDNV